MRVSNSHLLSVLTFSSLTLFVSASAPTKPAVNSTISVKPPLAKVQTGGTAKIHCSASNNALLSWYGPNGTYIATSNHSSTNASTHVFQDTKGYLTVRDARLGVDSGVYTCALVNLRTQNATCVVDVYVMPTYFVEGMVLLGLNAFLVVVFLVCFAHSFVKTRRLERARKYKTLDKSSATKVQSFFKNH